MINFIHSIYIRIKNKLIKIKKKKSWNNIPSNNSNVFFSKKMQLYDPHLVGLQTLGDQCKSAETAREVLGILNKLEGEPCIDFVKGFISKGLEIHGKLSNWSKCS